MSLDQVLLDIAPEMSDVDSALRLRLIDIASLQVKFGSSSIKELATAYLAAHVYTLSKRRGAGGSVSSESEGDLSRSYSNNSMVGSLGQTTYGQEFTRLQRMFMFNPRTRVDIDGGIN